MKIHNLAFLLVMQALCVQCNFGETYRITKSFYSYPAAN